MKLLLVLAVAVCTLACALARPEDHYDDKYDNFNVDEMTSNKRLLEAYTKCFLDKGKCTPEGTDIKKFIPEATTSSCGKCTEKQKVLAAKTIKAIEAQLPDEYAELLKKNDPEGKYGEELKAFLDKYGA